MKSVLNLAQERRKPVVGPGTVDQGLLGITREPTDRCEELGQGGG